MLLPRGKEGECEHPRPELRMSHALVLCAPPAPHRQPPGLGKSSHPLGEACGLRWWAGPQ